jgi:anti-sigma factor RsiW
MIERANCNLGEGESLSAYIDGRLDGEETRAVAAHLLGCDACRRELDLLVATKGALRVIATPSVPPNPEFWSNAYRAARLSRPAEKTSTGWLGRHLTLSPANRLVASMTAFVAVVLVFMLPTALHQPGSVPPQSVVSRADADENTLNVSDLVRSHTQYAATQPLTDDSRLSMVLSEESARREAADTDREATADGSLADDGFGPGTAPDAFVSSN